MAMTVADLWLQSGLLDAVRADFAERVGAATRAASEKP
jgi:hypothetical protein